MQKIPTLFKRDPDNMARVLPEVHPDCQWVLDGEGTATRKYDGTCVRFTEDGLWWARREVKPGKAAPANFVPAQLDEVTGKMVGWEPIEQSAFVRWFNAALEYHAGLDEALKPGTYELCGPQVNGNPEGYKRHILIRHSAAERLLEVPRDFDGLAKRMAETGFEGIVWHHPDGRMAKLKHRDFRA